MADDDPLLTQRQAADYLNISIRTLQRWRAEGIGPASFVLPNGYRRYRRSVLDGWLAEHGDAGSPGRTSGAHDTDCGRPMMTDNDQR